MTHQSSMALENDPRTDENLRAAFVRLDLERVCKMTFEQFVSDSTRSKCLANVIEARLRAQNPESSGHPL